MYHPCMAAELAQILPILQALKLYFYNNESLHKS